MQMNRCLKFLVINGPNLNLLGKLRPEDGITLASIEEGLNSRRRELEAKHDVVIVLHFRQSNNEGDLISWVGDAPGNFDGIVINPSTYASTSFSLAIAVRAVCDRVPAVEVHLSPASARSEPLQHSLLADACLDLIEGRNANSYDALVYGTALEYLLKHVLEEQEKSRQHKAETTIAFPKVRAG